MKTGQIMKSPEWRWYEPQHAVLGGGHYFTHAWGSIYVLSGKAAANIARMPEGSLRFFANEGVSQQILPCMGIVTGVQCHCMSDVVSLHSCVLPNGIAATTLLAVGGAWLLHCTQLM